MGKGSDASNSVLSGLSDSKIYKRGTLTERNRTWNSGESPGLEVQDWRAAVASSCLTARQQVQCFINNGLPPVIES